MKKLAVLTAVLCFIASSAFGSNPPGTIERNVHMKGFAGKIALRELAGDKIEVRMRTWRTTRDTIPGHALFPVLVNGHKQSFFFGRFGGSKLPVLIFAVSNPDRIDEYRAQCYQVSPRGSLIGQQVVVDEAIQHGHTDDVVSGRYQLADINPDLGTIYSIAYQNAHFEGFFVSYEKLRVRQWDQSINAFIETDQGFLRERNGRLVEAAKFHQWPERKREELFVANIGQLPQFQSHMALESIVKPVSAQLSKK